MTTGTNAWIEDELAGCHFADERLGRRLSTLLDQMAGAMGDSIPLAGVVKLPTGRGIADRRPVVASQVS